MNKRTRNSSKEQIASLVWNDCSPVPTNLSIGVRQFMFNKKEPRLEPVF
jgi:hypothetical protein